jgi:hypothetical protein
VEHTFVIRNEGALTLQIPNIRPSCGCTVAEISRRDIPPGESAEITTKLSLRGRRGRQHKGITLETNDPQNSRYMLYLSGTALEQLTVSPNRLYLGQVSPHDNISREISITARSPVKIESVESSLDCLPARLDTIEDGKSYKITVQAQPPLPEGRLNGYILIRKQGGSTINIPVTASVVGQIAYAPREILLKRQPDTRVTRYVIVRPGQTAEFNIVKVDTPDPEIQVSIQPMSGNSYRIQLANINPAAHLRDQHITITTDLADMETITIPFKVVD